MNPTALAICFFFLPSISNADSTLMAGGLEKICTSPAEADHLICSLIVKAYKDGFIEGVANGAIGTYKNDPEIWVTIKDTKAAAFVQKINKVIKQSTCIQSIQTDDLITTFTAYMKTHPSDESSPYRIAMFRAIEEKYCHMPSAESAVTP